MQRIRKLVRRWTLILLIAFFSQAIPDLDEIPMIWSAIMSSHDQSMEVAEAAESDD